MRISGFDLVNPGLRSEWPRQYGQYGLTPAEATVLELVAGGLRVSEIAEVLGVRVCTVRTHLSRVFSKTDTHRQLDLVRLVAVGSLRQPQGSIGSDGR
jgi:DNA-binding CsgD family transcriptional regulator